jgi:hypothetical protein
LSGCKCRQLARRCRRWIRTRRHRTRPPSDLTPPSIVLGRCRTSIIHCGHTAGAPGRRRRPTSGPIRRDVSGESAIPSAVGAGLELDGAQPAPFG